MTSEKLLLTEISNKLDKLIGITAIAGKEKQEQILILARLGFTNKEISNLTGIPKGTVDVTRAKKGGKNGNKPRTEQ